MVKQENKKWIVVGLILLLILLSNQRQEPKKTIIPVLTYGATQVLLPAGTILTGAALSSTGGGAALGVPLMIIGGVMLLVSFIGFQWLSSNFIWILGALVLIVFFKTMSKKRMR